MKLKTACALTITVLLLASSGCARDVANRYYGSTRYPAKKPTDVLMLNSRPSQDFEVIADFQSRGETPEELREKAAEIGADAVIVSMIGGHYDRSAQWASHGNNGTYSHIVGTAIIFKKGDKKK
jgi:putative N-acetylmannosamine-6-phosphate epimerase